MARTCILFLFFSYSLFSKETIYNIVLNDYLTILSIKDTIAISELFDSKIFPQDLWEGQIKYMIRVDKSFHYKQLKPIFDDFIIKDSFKIKIPYVIHSKKIINEYFTYDTTFDSWTRYKKEFPNYHYLIYISKIIYNKKQNRCFLFIGHFKQGPFCSFGYYYLKKTRTGWKIKKHRCLMKG